MGQTYGIDTALWVRLPPDDQAAVKAEFLGQPPPPIGGYAPIVPGPTATPVLATPLPATPLPATPAPPPTLSSSGAQAYALLNPPTGAKPVVGIVKPIEKATILPKAEIRASTLAAREAALGSLEIFNTGPRGTKAIQTVGGISVVQATRIASDYGLSRPAASMNAARSDSGTETIGGVSIAQATQIASNYGLPQPVPSTNARGSDSDTETIGGVSVAQAIEIAIDYGLPQPVVSKTAARSDSGAETIGGVSVARAVKIAKSHGLPQPARAISAVTPPPNASRPILGPQRVQEAGRLTVEQRLAIFQQFFAQYGGPGTGLGYGTAALTFLDWEIGSGRIADKGGSDWWEVVNGMMALDLQSAMANLARGTPAPTKAIGAWMAFATATVVGSARQKLFWTAHETSLHEGIAFAGADYANLPSNERSFVQEAVDLVDLAALGNSSSSASHGVYAIRNIVGTWYPKGYPASTSAIGDLLDVMKIAQLARNLPSVGPGVVGLRATRWHWG